MIKLRRPTPDASPRFSRTIVRNCLDSMQAFLSEDASTDSKFSLSQSITDFRILSVMCAPMVAGEKAFGVIQLDSQDRSKKFNQDDLKLLLGVANQASVAFEMARLHEDLIQRERHAAGRGTRAAGPAKLFAATVARSDRVPVFRSLQCGTDNRRRLLRFHSVSGRQIRGPARRRGWQRRAGRLTDGQIQRRSPVVHADEFGSGQGDRMFQRRAVANHAGGRHGSIRDAGGHGARSEHESPVTIINAGHMTPLDLSPRKNKTLEDAISNPCLAFHWAHRKHYIEAGHVELHAGDSLILYTDGVSDAVSTQNAVVLDVDGIRGRSLEAADGMSTAHPDMFGRSVVEAVGKHAAGEPTRRYRAGVFWAARWFVLGVHAARTGFRSVLAVDRLIRQATRSRWENDDERTNHIADAAGCSRSKSNRFGGSRRTTSSCSTTTITLTST